MPEPVCLACGGSTLSKWATARDVEYATSDEEFAYLRCSDCDTLSIASPPLDRLAEIYPGNYYSFGGAPTSLVERVKQWLDRRMFRGLFLQLNGASLRALDVGGGNGWLLSLARQVEPRLSRTVVVDLDPAAKEAAETLGHAFVLGRVEEYDSDEKFDLILLLNLIEHVADPQAVLRKMASLLAENGRILVKTPNHDSLDARLFRHRSWGGYHCPRHWVIFTPEGFAKAVDASGLEVRTMNLTQGAPFWAVSILQLLVARGLASVDRNRPMYQHPLFGVFLGLFAIVDILRRPFARTSQMFFELSHPSES